MLALKAVLSSADETPTLVFDEIDQGIGGRVGATVGAKLWGLATGPVLTAVASPLVQIPVWEFGLAHLLYGLAAGYQLQTNT